MRFISALTILFLFSSCGPIKNHIKKSANQELFDTKGFDGKKRAPVYNPKYVERAKRNIAKGNLSQYEDDSSQNEYYEPGELVSYDDSNRKMYHDMIEMNRYKQQLREKSSVYNKLSDYSDIKPSAKSENTSLQKELAQIKKALDETNEKLASSKCYGTKEQLAKKSLAADETLRPKQNKSDLLSAFLKSSQN